MTPQQTKLKRESRVKIRELQDIVDGYVKQYGLKPIKVRVSWKVNPPTHIPRQMRLGLYRHRQKEIKINWLLFDENLRRQLYETLLHELSHGIDMERNTEPCTWDPHRVVVKEGVYGWKGHGRHFRGIFRTLKDHFKQKYNLPLERVGPGPLVGVLNEYLPLERRIDVSKLKFREVGNGT